MCFFIPILLGIGANVEIDFALSEHQNEWLRHPVYGDASFDSFARYPNNPMLRGATPLEWPVNGSLFQDPVSGHWYVYAGRYVRGYALTETTPSLCTVLCSQDEGRHWEEIGPALAWNEHLFDGEVSPLWHAPDASVIFSDGSYHMTFDWTTKNTTWANATHPEPNTNSGVGYACSDTPEGPFRIARQPVVSTRSQPLLAGRYRRMYASSIHRRKNDWLVLTLTDSGPYFGWALVGMTSKSPEGPYGEAQLLLHPNSTRFHPPLMEFFPSFTHEGQLYAPATSVAANRNFQCLFRVPLERAMEPEAWELWQYGSLWHAEPVEHEACGIWGQTFSAAIDRRGVLTALFPSRDSKNFGTLNLAQRPWARPFRPRGFVASAHQAPTFLRLKPEGSLGSLQARMRIRGPVRILLNGVGPLGPEKPRSDAAPHVLAWKSASDALEFRDKEWSLLVGGQPLASGALKTDAGNTIAEAQIEWQADRNATVRIDGDMVWQGSWAPPSGPLALHILLGGWAHVEEFKLKGVLVAGATEYLCTEALLGAAQNEADWEYREGPEFRHGFGAVALGANVEAKWNFEGTGCALWSPQAPEFGQAEILLNGHSMGILDFSSAAPMDSKVVYQKEGLEGRFHALILRAKSGRIPLDVLCAKY